jgi:hypothetical protein
MEDRTVLLVASLFAAIAALAQDPQAYLWGTYPEQAPLFDCVIWNESRWQPDVIGAGIYVGLAQFDLPTWLATPQGEAGQSRYDPIASIDALAWGWVHLGPHRWPVSSRICLYGH